MATTASSEAQPPSMEPKPTKVRKRAPKACLSCRARKVRCDVSQRGRPCMNCYLDSETCVVTGRATRFRRPHRDTLEGAQDSVDTTNNEADIHGKAATEVSLDARQQRTSNVDADMDRNTARRDSEAQQNLAHNSRPSQVNQAASRSSGTERSSVQGGSRTVERSFNELPNPSNAPAGHGGSTFTDPEPSIPMMNDGADGTGAFARDPSATLASSVVYSYYPFITIGNLASIPPHDINFLELQGCLRVPVRDYLDEFLQQYFLHVHPLLPLINEGDFWELYCHNPNNGMPSERVSLLLLQSILFASCTFVSRATIKALGYPNIRTIRAALYRRAKLLYDLESEASPLPIAQAALLLSCWSPPTTRKPNTSWLSVAIQHAKSADAHHFAAMPLFSAQSHPMQHRKQNILKRVWWCCIIRDRLLSLLMRRPLQITKMHFDFDSNPLLGFADLEDEFERSRVYNRGAKRNLAEILAHVVELFVGLTDVLMLVFPLDDAPGWGRQGPENHEALVREYRTLLRRWHKSATLRFPSFESGVDSRLSAEKKNEFQHDSVILYTNLMYMYYHSSCVVLAHHEILHSAIIQAVPADNSSDTSASTKGLSTIYENRQELQEAISGVTECLKELVQRKLARWLPISAVACTALPLVLNILDVKLSTSAIKSDGSPNSVPPLKQRRLNILIEAMKTYQPQYDGVDYVSGIIRHVVNLAQVDATTTRGSDQSGISDWTDILSLQPSSYLRLALSLDVGLSKGRLPEDGDFPVSLQGLFVGGFSPLKALMEAKRTNPRRVGFQSMDSMNLSNGSISEQGSEPSPDSLSDSHMSNTEEATLEALRDQIQSQMGNTESMHMDILPTDGIEGLGADASAMFLGEDDSPSGLSDFQGMFLDGPMPDISAEWIENVLGESGDTEDKGDRDVARALLGALKEADTGQVKG